MSSPTAPTGGGVLAAPAGPSARPAPVRRLGPPLRLAAGGLAAVALVAVRDPHVPGAYGSCPFRAVTGLWCPGCGGLRAVHDLAHLDLAAAWGMNPLVVAAVPVLLVVWLVWLRRAWAGTPPRMPSTRLIAVLGGVVAVFWVLRNVPALAPWLAP